MLENHIEPPRGGVALRRLWWVLQRQATKSPRIYGDFTANVRENG